MNKIAILKDLLEKPGIVVAPGVYDCISAKIVQRNGFKAVYMTGNGAVAGHIGKPDIGLATMDQMVEWAKFISESVDIPLISDADNGYGDLNNVRYTVQSFEKAGVCAIHLEDQSFPKKCGCMDGVTIIKAEDAAEKIQVAAKSRHEMLIIARSDCFSTHQDTKEMIRRLSMYSDAGADILFPEMIENLDQLKEITSVVNKPVLFDTLECVWNGRIPTIKELEEAGVKIVINALSLMWFNCTQMDKFLADYKKTGDLKPYAEKIMDIHEYEKILGIEDENNIRDLLKFKRSQI
jgi:2-methylisocitrate lyase-like PEP mutase family enzyme